MVRGGAGGRRTARSACRLRRRCRTRMLDGAERGRRRLRPGSRICRINHGDQRADRQRLPFARDELA